MKLIWATRGRNWGFKILRSGGLANPLEVYEAAFNGSDGAAFTFTQRAETLAVRFPDPEERKDRAGRVISQEFVVLAPDHFRFSDCESVRSELWHEVEDEYATIWDRASATGTQ